MTKQLYTVTVVSENKPGVLYRIAGIFVRRKINVESLEVHETATKGISKFTIIINADQENIEKVLSQIRRVIEVINASIEI